MARAKQPVLFLALVFVLAFTLGFGGAILVQGQLAPKTALNPTPMPTPSAAPMQTPGPTPKAGPNPIPAENAHLGTTSWIYPSSAIAETEIQGYANESSVAPNDTLTFYVSVRDSGVAYTATIYRLGWYGGTGARQMLTLSRKGVEQGYYNQLSQQLINCSTCTVDPTTHLVQANWAPSFRVRIPADWTTGVYLTELRESVTGKVAMLYFVVRGNASAPILVTTPDTTNAAYNTWGGYSLYTGPSFTLNDRATSVSFDRPVTPFGGFDWQIAASQTYDQGLPTFINALRWFERSGYNLSYESDIDVDVRPESTRGHHVLISMGHDEYWSATMRTAFEQARNQGHSLIFLGANAVYWKITFAPNAAGLADHIIICEKAGADTNEWRLSAPENALIGVMFSSNISSGKGYPWRLAVDASSPLLDNTGLVPGMTYGCDLVGYEWDRVSDNGQSPQGIVALSESPAMDVSNKLDISNTTYYYASSGALVFASGSIYWARSLDSFRFFPSGDCNPQSDVVPGMQRLMSNVMAAALAA